MAKRVAGTVCIISGHGSFREHEAGEVPAPKDMPGVQGIFVGGCVVRGLGRISETNKNAQAHAHIHNGMYQGWVCFQLPVYLDDKSLRMHQLAHIQTGEYHTNKWREAMARLGQEVSRQYARICS